ncbi:protein transport protein Sec61 subunit gamma isoform X4 [Drosophila sulfurigaster albostrigata]|uniref:protein transport protein Sec61 subunit gamma isoform X3 n=1 Tax=Drosophila sulfurigaster albostrigata TaxID=89887 RepID=UPI002D218928|nr:protein transport protein Sec61 subunit gamma isoform X3 [Drosophila sulfurigaster albostrigata]XP_062134777.1 protein transport protein Sec61 subunit gamma isoform X4 [Drosophila sulfurigaster albostrigata]
MDQHLMRRRRARRKHKSGFIWEVIFKFRSLRSYRRLACLQLALFMDFVKDSAKVINRCTKPDRQEFQRTALAITLGFFIMGFLGYTIKLLHMPITNIIMG